MHTERGWSHTASETAPLPLCPSTLHVAVKLSGSWLLWRWSGELRNSNPPRFAFSVPFIHFCFTWWGFFLRGGLSPVGQPESLRGNQEGEAWKTGSTDAFRLSEKTNTQVEWWVERYCIVCHNFIFRLNENYENESTVHAYMFERETLKERLCVCVGIVADLFI